jgi:hypothetical protein
MGPRGTGEVRRGEAPVTPAPGTEPGGPRPEEPAENGAFRVRNEAPHGQGDDVPAAVRPTDEARPPGPPVPTRRPNGRSGATDPVRSASSAVAPPQTKGATMNDDPGSAVSGTEIARPSARDRAPAPRHTRVARRPRRRARPTATQPRREAEAVPAGPRVPRQTSGRRSTSMPSPARSSAHRRVRVRPGRAAGRAAVDAEEAEADRGPPRPARRPRRQPRPPRPRPKPNRSTGRPRDRLRRRPGRADGAPAADVVGARPSLQARPPRLRTRTGTSAPRLRRGPPPPRRPRAGKPTSRGGPRPNRRRPRRKSSVGRRRASDDSGRDGRRCDAGASRCPSSLGSPTR